MRHEQFPSSIHPMRCRCDRCARPMDPELAGDLATVLWGCIASAIICPVFVLIHFWPAIRAALFG